MGTITITLMIITLISKITGLIREQVFTYFLGTGMLREVYITSLNIPTTIISFLTAGVIAGFIPIYHRVLHEKGEDEANLFTSNLVNILLIVATGFVFVIFLISPFLVTLFASGYEGMKRELTIIFTRIMSFSLYGSVLSSIYIGYLQIKNKFLISETAGIIMNFFYVTTLLLAVYFDNLFIIPIGILISDYMKYVLFPREIGKSGYKHKWYINIHDHYIKDLISITLPILISIAALDISTISDQTFASQVLPNGGVANMKTAQLILTLITGVIVVSITTAIYPMISKYASEGKLRKVKSALMDGNTYSFILLLPAMVGVMILAEPMVKILFQRGHFTSEATALTSGVLIYYMPTLLGQTISQILTRGFYSLKNTKTPIFITIIQVLVNILLNYILSKVLGLNGLALATTISVFISGFLSLYYFKKAYGDLGLRKFAISALKISIATAIMGVFTYLTYHGLKEGSEIIAFLVAIIVSIFVYGIVLLFVRVDHVRKLLNLLYRKYRRR